MTEKYDHIFKLLLIGDSAVGKSSILLRFTDDNFVSDQATTIGVDFKVKYMQVKKKKVKLTIWDTAGQERFRTLTSTYYRGAHAAILVYDITNKTSFDNLKQWIKEIDAYTSFPDVVKLLVGNKCDLSDQRKVTKQAGEEFARTNGMLFIECSAKTKMGIDQAFDEVARKVLETPTLIDNSAPVKLGQDLNTPPEENGSNNGLCSYCA